MFTYCFWVCRITFLNPLFLLTTISDFKRSVSNSSFKKFLPISDPAHFFKRVLFEPHKMICLNVIKDYFEKMGRKNLGNLKCRRHGFVGLLHSLSTQVDTRPTLLWRQVFDSMGWTDASILWITIERYYI